MASKGTSILVVISLSVPVVCANANESRRPEVARPATRSATQRPETPTTSPATAASAPVVEPIGVRKKGRYRIRTFELKPGDKLQTERGGAIELRAVSKDEVVLRRTDSWTIPARAMEHSIGNSEYIRIVSVDHDAPSIRLELRTVTKKYPWEAFSF